MLLLYSKDKYLLVRHYRRGWDIPGGYVELGEDIIEALARETMEEVQSSFKNPVLRAVYRNVQPERCSEGECTKLILGFRAECMEENFAPNEEILEIRWVTVKEAAILLTDELQKSRFMDLLEESEGILYSAYERSPYRELRRIRI